MEFKLFYVCSLLLSTTLAQSSNSVTFKNVVVRGYFFTNKFNVTIQSSNSLKDNLPNEVFDTIKIINSKIPVLYQNSISDIEGLDELILVNDSISEIQPGTFKNLPSLLRLEIKNNPDLKEIKSGVFNNLTIESLVLSHNSINTIASDAFNDMPNLSGITLFDNKIKIWNNNWFHNTPLLKSVSFRNNFIEDIPSEAFKNLQGEKQDGSLTLSFKNNKIKRIDENAFKGLDKIDNLWLDGNEIDSWNENLLSNVELKELRIDNNKLECLRGDLKNIFVANTTYIDGNPWDCGCLENIDLWASQHGKDVIRPSSKMTCDALKNNDTEKE